jgi:hypothetical protein
MTQKGKLYNFGILFVILLNFFARYFLYL